MSMASSAPSVTCPSSPGDLPAGRPRQEHDDAATRVRTGEWVGCDDRRELTVGPRQDTDVQPEFTLDRAFDAARDAGWIATAPVDDVAALEVRLDVVTAQGHVQSP